MVERIPMTLPVRTMKLGAFLQANGNHLMAWRHPDANAEIPFDVRPYRTLARQAESAGFDLLFFADTLGFEFQNGIDETVAASGRVVGYEPLTLLSHLAAVTETIGLVGTVSTSFSEPYNIARMLASLDRMSGGRCGWNVVTSGSDREAQNFSRDRHFDHADRYERAREYVDVVRKLWRSWEIDAFPRDKASGRFLDPSRHNPVEHVGTHFSVRGPLNVIPATPAGPVIVQAGASPAGLDLAAGTAELIFAACRGGQDARDQIERLGVALAHHGRARSDIRFLPGFVPIVGATRDEARARFDELQALISPDTALMTLQSMLPGVPLDIHDPHAPFPLDLATTNASRSRQLLIEAIASDHGSSILDVANRAAAFRGHWLAVGTAHDIVDEMEACFLAGDVDGFNIMPAYLPGGFTDICEQLLPELRKRGLIGERSDVPRTLRERLA